MRTFLLGKKQFCISSITLAATDKLMAKIKSMEIPELDENGQADIGDAIHFVLLAVYEDEDKALRVGKELIEEDYEFITLDQVQRAIKTIREAICDVTEKINAFTKEIRG